MEYRLATGLGPLPWHDFAHRAFSERAQLADALVDGTYSAGAFVEGELHGCLCVGPADKPLQFARLSAADVLDDAVLVQARLLDETIGLAEPVVCACFGVKLDVLREAIACGEPETLAQIGRKFTAGPN